jgi:hypothetical protein
MLGLNLNGLMIAGVAAFLAGAATSAMFYEKAIVPGREHAVEVRVTRDVEERMALAVKAAAAEAIAGELARRQAAINAALTAYQNAVADDQAEADARLKELEEENRRYADQLAANGRSCPLDDDGLRFLGGVQNP